jgi:hypothetical protein
MAAREDRYGNGAVFAVRLRRVQLPKPGTAIGGAHVIIGNATATADSSGVHALTVPAGEQSVSIDGESLGIINMKDRTYLVGV